MGERRDPGPEILRSRRNPRVLHARRLASDPRTARRTGRLVADGTLLVREALRAGLAPEAVFLDPNGPDRGAIEAECRHSRVEPILVSAGVIQAISTLTTPQAAVGIFHRPQTDLAALLGAPDRPGPPFVAVLHGLQDPANAGSLVRTGLAAGLTGILATEGTVDLFHPRAIRASMGAAFRLPIVSDLPAARTWEILRQGGYRTLALDPRGSVALEELVLDRPTAVLLGREGSGLDAEARSACDASVRISMAAGVESLGVAAAGAVVFYTLALHRSS